MPRKGEVVRRETEPDKKYGNIYVQSLINIVLRKGKKSTAERIVYGAFDMIAEKTKKDPLEVFKQALDNIRPLLELKSRRVGGATYQVPIDVDMKRGMSLGLRWMVAYSRERKGRPMSEKLAQEIMDATNNIGGAMKKREDTHKMAEANKAFAHYRW